MDNAPVSAKMKWIGQVEATVTRLHDVGIIWGDVKPDSVIINPDGDAILADFRGRGAIRLDISGQNYDRQTVEGDLVGLGHMRAANMGLQPAKR